MLNVSEATRTDFRGDGSAVFVFRCIGCEKELRVDKCDLSQHRGLCRSCGAIAGPAQRATQCVQVTSTRADRLDCAGVKRLWTAVIVDAVQEFASGDAEARAWLYEDADADIAFQCAGLDRERFLSGLSRCARSNQPARLAA